MEIKGRWISKTISSQHYLWTLGTGVGMAARLSTLDTSARAGISARIPTPQRFSPHGILRITHCLWPFRSENSRVHLPLLALDILYHLLLVFLNLEFFIKIPLFFFSITLSLKKNIYLFIWLGQVLAAALGFSRCGSQA